LANARDIRGKSPFLGGVAINNERSQEGCLKSIQKTYRVLRIDVPKKMQGCLIFYVVMSMIGRNGFSTSPKQGRCDAVHQ
jgi:hypothetical protein